MSAPITLFAVVFALNVIPAFAPPTWMALSWVGFSHPLGNPFLVALIGALAATSGRLLLARLSRAVIRQRFMSDRMRANIDVIKEGLERHRTLTFGAFLLYAFGPFPSNYLFIAYGMTSLPFWLVALPFFIGRCFSYSFFVFTAAEVSQHFFPDGFEPKPYLGVYFVTSQILLLGFLFLLARIDWRYFVAMKRFRWLRAPDVGTQ